MSQAAFDRLDLYDAPSNAEQCDLEAAQSRDCSREVVLRRATVRRTRLNANTVTLKRELNSRGLTPTNVGFIGFAVSHVRGLLPYTVDRGCNILL